MDMTKYTVDNINTCSYTDFVGLVNQWNVGPGAYDSVNKWSIFGHVKEDSRILEVACTTGFSSREMAKLTGCSGVGIDISKASIEQAIVNRDLYAKGVNIDYIVKDGYKYEFNKSFTHVITGASLRFFPDPQKMLTKILSLLEDGGYLLSNEFFVVKKIPDNLVKEAKEVFDIDITQVGYKNVMTIYRGLEIMYEEKRSIEQETDDELEHYTTSTVDRVFKEKKLKGDDLYDAMYKRLYKVKDMSNRLRPYQNYNVLVLRYNKTNYPDRYVELF